ncbi:MAG: nitroreductase family protein [Paludibacteraceae bacterium]|nr:nitroreductase family protein [Paludibacteraceae bacterium]
MKKTFLFACVAMMLAACTHSNEQMTNGFINLARQRYAVREYAPTPVEQTKLDSILEAGRLAPTARNVQPQHIYVLQSPEAIAKINELTRCAYGAPVVFLVCYDTDSVWTKDGSNSGDMDCSIVGTHMMMEATELGLGTCWVKWFNPAEVATAFELPANHRPSFLMPCGYAAETSKPSDHHFSRKPLSETVTYK